ncbi:hypothetical protein [Maricaulis sp.]|uniref:hypothetical protein n=1 Tax=Maricaulis sp. TaxID=1486257 RepID=UPI002623D015|nr:hypothetical protein [Maricaulis sp.]
MLQSNALLAGFVLAMSAQVALIIIVAGILGLGMVTGVDDSGVIAFALAFLAGLPFILVTSLVLNVSLPRLAGEELKQAVEAICESNPKATNQFRLGYLLGPAALIGTAYLLLALLGGL